MRPRGVREAIARALVNEDREFAAHALVGRPLVGPRAALVRRRGGGVAPGRLARRPRAGAARGGLRPDPAHRRAPGLVLRQRRSGACAGCSTCPSAAPARAAGAAIPSGSCPGDTVDFWRVEEVEPDRLLRLSAEMTLPGRAWLQFEVEPDGRRARSSARRRSSTRSGSCGRLYWYSVWPLHGLVFRGHGARHRPRGRRGRGTPRDPSQRGAGVSAGARRRASPNGSWAGWPRTARSSTG